ncbi:protein of unknown function [Georgfuchsia toluolica]|uniref:Uncharacterized protein n=1 Tax=Georgfuchsia toluolica TaxID=424218 RepID=A0A916J3C0_9PROT|nr:protein of unknown function [Georgfuchsia toluolica]
MMIDNQIESPESFMAMYVTPGRDRPNAPQDVVLARYEGCEGMACMLIEYAQKLAFDEGMERKVLHQFHQGLLAEPSNLSAQESVWVMHRLAELLDWGRWFSKNDLLAVQQHAFALFTPTGFVGLQQLVEIGRRSGGVVHPFAQQRAAVDDVDGELVQLVFVGKVAPQRVVRIEAADGLEGQRI